VLIHYFGRHWSPVVVKWGHPGELVGILKKKKKVDPIDFWDAKGIYVLHRDFQIVYVGQTERQTLGKRIQDHLSDDLAGRWDSFSWYSVSKLTKTGKVRKLGARTNSTVAWTSIITTLEAIGIKFAPSALNKRETAIPGAEECLQRVDKETKKLLQMSLVDDRRLWARIGSKA
jgi:hypothetical protein